MLLVVQGIELDCSNLRLLYNSERFRRYIKVIAYFEIKITRQRQFCNCLRVTHLSGL